MSKYQIVITDETGREYEKRIVEVHSVDDAERIAWNMSRRYQWIWKGVDIDWSITPLSKEIQKNWILNLLSFLFGS